MASSTSLKSLPKVLDVETTVQSILRDNTKEGFEDITVISCANHLYLSQWKSIQWNISTFKGIVETVRRHEVNDLKYGGRSAWILYMMLEHGTQTRSWSFFEQDKDLVNTMLATLLRILIEHSNYNQIYHIFRSLINSYGLNPIEIFSSGCELLELLPAIIKDENFICLLELGVTSIEKDPSCRPYAIKMLSNCSKFVICNWKSNFFLDQKLSILSSGLEQKPQEIANACDSTFDTIQLFRRLATIQEQNAEHILNSAHVIDNLCSLILSDITISFHIRREILATFNVLTRVKNGRSRVQSILSMAQLSDLVIGGDDLLVTESVVDLFFNLYEAEMEYWDDAFHYMIQDGCPHSLFFKKVLQHCIQTLEDDFPVITASDENETPVSASSKPTASIHLDAVARICFRLERSVFVLSDARSFLSLKTSLLQICARIVGDDFARFSLRNHSVIDIICYILRGTQRCWLPATFDSLDEDFIYVSSSLVEQFLTVTKKKIFDQKDTNSLHYLAGADAHSPIQMMIAKSNEDQQSVEAANLRRHKVRGNSSLSIDDTVGILPENTTGLEEVPELSFPSTSGLESPRDIIVKEQERKSFLNVVESLLQQIVRRMSWLQHNVDNWELDSSDVVARRVCYMTLIVRLFGVTLLEDLVPHFDNLRSVVFHLLVDPSLSLSAYLGIESKCLQLLSLLCLHYGGFDQSVQCYEYLINIISSNPEMLSERRRSEYQREQVSMDNSNAHDANLSLSDTSLLGSQPLSAPNVLLEMSNLMGIQLQLLYDAVNVLLVLSEVERSVRRKLVSSCANLLDCLSYYVPVDPITHRPVLHLTSSFIEYASKFEVEAEEAIVTMIIRTLNSSLHYIRYQSCTYIYNIGTESPGFIFRGLSRREVEDPVLDIITHSPFEYPRLIVAAIKASATLVHNFNIKPVWFPSLILYHWRCYQPHLAHRPLLGVSGLALVINLLQHAQVPYRLLYFTYTLSLSASLMYACSELTGNPNQDDMRALQEMKDYLIVHVLPWLPLAIDFISLGKRKRRFDFMEMLSPHHEKVTTQTHASSSVSVPVTTSPPTSKQVKPFDEKEKEHIDVILHRLYTKTSLPASCTTSSEEHYMPFHAVHHNAWSFLDVVLNIDKFDKKASVIGEVSELVTVHLNMERVSAINVALTASEPPSETSSLKKDLHDHAISSEKCTPTPTASEQSEQLVIDAFKTSLPVTSPYHRHAHHQYHYHHAHRKHRHHHHLDTAAAENVYRSKSMEFLTVKTVDALYAFLCMDDMFPLSTYLRFSHLFEQCHVIASVSYFMCEHYENALILKRGLDLLRYFSDHQMQLSSIAMHSPPALIATVRFMQDSLEAQLSFAKIILAICRTDDDFARENLLRFRVHQVLLELVLREPNAELVRTSIQALLALATTVAHLREIAKLELPAYLAPVRSTSSSYGSSNNSNSGNNLPFLGTGALVPPESIITNNGNSNNNNASAHNSATGSSVVTTVTGGGSQKILSTRRTSKVPVDTSTATTSQQQSNSHSPANAPLPSTTSTTSSASHAHMLHTSDASHFLAYQSNPPSTPFSIIQKPSSTTTTAATSSIVSIPKSSSTSSIYTSLPSNLATINLIDVLLYVLDTQTKEIRTHFYALRLLILVETQYKSAVHQVLRKSPFAGAIKKSKKALKKTYIDDASGDHNNNLAASLTNGSPTQHLHHTHSTSNNNSNTHSSNSSHSNSNNHVSQNGAVLYRGMSTDQSNSAALGKSEEIERREVEILLNEGIIKNDRCVIS